MAAASIPTTGPVIPWIWDIGFVSAIEEHFDKVSFRL
ncbi:hypothetical protein COLO4_38126 [Corchorus olitorius]|uniref:Uncharacterized protein n=1 Tax=Corchorus olitorius TaxID=93759 RepID=A0A1R3FX72_9ROSI|nr:hypothetical protein COLO4_38126 [Corchorus olitorius]